LVEVLEELLNVDTIDAWVERLTALGVPAGKVGSISDAFELADRLGLNPSVSLGEGQAPQVRNPISLSETPITRYGRPPVLGEHNEQVRRWLTKENK
jgi:crotonobetainyl-CoA:carnitine CoA-transferase CaiB-like acyl-CoA transferase